jgi:hypothetical protein
MSIFAVALLAQAAPQAHYIRRPRFVLQMLFCRAICAGGVCGMAPKARLFC